LISMEDHTFVIPAYKDSTFIEECIVSLKNQTRKSHICIITSTPSKYLQDVAQRFSLPLVVNMDSKGIAGDWNFALAQAKTTWVTIAHQDDIYESTFLQKVLQKTNKKNVLIFFTDYCEIIHGRTRRHSLNFFIKKILLFPFLIKPCIKNRFFRRLPLVFGNAVCCPSVTFNKPGLKDFTFSPDFSYSLDWKAWLDMTNREGAFIFINKKLMKHRIHKDSETTKQLGTNVRKKEELRIFRIIWGKRVAGLLGRIYTLSHKDNIL